MIDTGAHRADLTGGVRVVTSTGYIIETEGVSAALDVTHMQSGGSITATGPMGKINASAMVLTQETDGDGVAYLLVFKQGVRLIYLPHPTQGGGQ